ncbi:MAG TPA: hypothetical protein VGA68_05560 [Woeseiaceae bacterium]|jgi:hypothetical protein
MSRSQHSPRAWFPAAILLSLYFYWSITEVFALHFEPGLFLPLLTGWLAHRFGHRVVGFLLFVGLLSAFTIDSSVFDTLSVGFGFSEWIYFVSVCSAVLFCRPTFSVNFGSILNKRWQWLRWLLPVAMWPAVFMDRKVNFELTDTLQIGTNPGFAILAILMSACINWKVLIEGAGSVILAERQRWLNYMRCAVLMVLALAIVVYIEWEHEYWFSVSFGFVDGFDVLLAFAFVVTATGIADWRLTILFLTLFLASEWPVYWLIDSIQAAIPAPPDTSLMGGDDRAIGEIVVAGSRIRPDLFWPGVINGVSIVLMAAGIAPFLQRWSLEYLNTRRTGIFLVLSLVVLLSGVPLVLYGIWSFGLFVIGGTAFVVGLRWGIKGIILAPLIIQLSCLLAVALLSSDPREGPGASDLVSIGLVAFPFAYFGLLSRRLSPVAAAVIDHSLAEGSKS